MTVPDAVETRILEKTSYVADAVSILASKQTLDRETYRSDREQRAIVEREFQTAIEACIDIAALLIGTLDVDTPETYADRFVVLADADVLSSETSTRMQRAAGFRNVLARVADVAIGRGSWPPLGGRLPVGCYSSRPASRSRTARQRRVGECDRRVTAS